LGIKLGEETTIAGKIEVSTKAIADIAGRAMTDCYGVVGTGSPYPGEGLVDVFRREKPHRGIEVRVTDNKVTVDLYVILEYGMRISEVANNLMNNVKYVLEKMLGLPDVTVNVHIQGLRISSAD